MIGSVLAILDIIFGDPSKKGTSKKGSGKASNNNAERTFIMIKPDGVQRKQVGDIIKKFNQRGFKLVALKMLKVCQTKIS